jgi:hypothetical protein
MAASPHITAAGVLADSHPATQASVHATHVPDEHSQHKRAVFPAQTSAAISSAAHPVVNAELVAAIMAALGAGGQYRRQAVAPHRGWGNIFPQRLRTLRVTFLLP